MVGSAFSFLSGLCSELGCHNLLLSLLSESELSACKTIRPELSPVR
jgi:hypothetical protein